MPALVPASPFLEVKQKDEVELVLLCYAFESSLALISRTSFSDSCEYRMIFLVIGWERFILKSFAQQIRQ